MAMHQVEPVHVMTPAVVSTAKLGLVSQELKFSKELEILSCQQGVVFMLLPYGFRSSKC